MAEVRVSRFVSADPTIVEDALDPTTILEAEGTFDVSDVEETPDGWTVTGHRRGLGVPFAFSEIEDGFRYEALGDHGPFREFEAEITYAPENHGTQLGAWSRVEVNFPVQVVADRIAGWKRRGELERALRNLARTVE